MCMKYVIHDLFLELISVFPSIQAKLQPLSSKIDTLVFHSLLVLKCLPVDESCLCELMVGVVWLPGKMAG